ncbi:MAG TPA: DUF2277 domain-containing protein, partial [Candidatus Eisenbacteria bacterium]|nr:DUF2277 domain-containing protein [Candidatus Eisenbacteria bacterium]
SRRARYRCRMCRSIKTLRQADVVATDEEIRAAARQFVRKVSGFREPSSRHQEAFEGAVDEIALASQRLLESISGKLTAARA